MNASPNGRLTGSDLLEKLNSLSATSLKQKAHACGYVLNTAQGPRIDSMRWYQALAQALAEQANLQLDSPSTRELSFVVTVQRSGSLTVGYSYLRSMGIEEGRKYKICLQDNGDIHLELIPN